jgi:hypothetical protein
MIVRPVRPAPTVRLVSVFAALALLPMITAHVIGAGVVDPLTDPISWYAFVPGGSLMIITGGALLALLGGLLTVRMYRSGLVTGILPGVAMAVFCLALIMVGLCPTDPPDSPVSISAIVHRVSAGTAFAVLPLVGLRVAACCRRPVSRLPLLLRRSAVLLGALVGAFLSIHLPLAFLGSGIAAFGFLERAGFVIMIGYLFLLGATIDREGAGRPGPDRAGAAVLMSPAPLSVLPSAGTPRPTASVPGQVRSGQPWSRSRTAA